MEKSFALRSEGKNSKTKELQLQKKAERKVVMKVQSNFLVTMENFQWFQLYYN